MGAGPSVPCREVVLFSEICCKPIRNFLKTKQHLKFVKHIMIYSTSSWCFSFSIAKWQEQLLLVVHEWIWIGVKTVFYLTTLPNLICNIPAYSSEQANLVWFVQHELSYIILKLYDIGVQLSLGWNGITLLYVPIKWSQCGSLTVTGTGTNSSLPSVLP